jgi:hypothetical protein
MASAPRRVTSPSCCFDFCCDAEQPFDRLMNWKQWLNSIVMNSAESQHVEGAADRRNEAIHRIGNLTLLTKELNPAVSNGPWVRKRDEILKHSALNLNRPFQDVQTWDEAAIETRSAKLFEVAKKIWPRTTSVSAVVA